MSAQVKGSAMGFEELIAPKKPAGSAVGFLDMIDDDEAAQVQAQQKEEEDWLKVSASSLHKNAALLDNLVTCMQPVKDAWGYYVPALLTLFREVDEGEALLRFLIDSEVRNTPREATLFREDSVRIQGVQYYILTAVREWIREIIYKPILRKTISGRSKNVDAVALEIVRALNDNIASVPSALQQTLTKIGQSVGARFPSLAKHCNKSACVFLFLHVLTPLVVNPFYAGLMTDELKDRETLLVLAKVGRTIQKWVNSSLGDDATDLTDTASSHSSDDRPDRSPRPGGVPLSGRLNSGESEVMRFYELVYKTDGVALVQKKPEPEECQDARQVITAVLKKNYKLLRELEAGLDRQNTLNKHLGQQQGKIFASFTRQATTEDLRASAKFSTAPEAMNAECVRAETAMAGSFSEFVRGSSGNFMLNGDRFVFMPALAWSSFLGSRFAVDLPQFFNQLNYAQFFKVGLENVRKFTRDGIFHESRSVAVLSMFPFLAFTGWGRFTLGVNSTVARSNEFFLSARTENALETSGIETKKGGECHCQALCGFMAGWCSEASGLNIQCVELQCTNKGDKACLFINAPETTLENHAKRMAADIKSSFVPKAPIISFVQAQLPGASVTDSPARRSKSGDSLVSSVQDAVDAIKMCFVREATKITKDKRERGMSLTDRLRANTAKKGTEKTTPEKRERGATLKKHAVSEEKPSPLVLEKTQRKKDAPASSPELGEVKIADGRFVAMRAKDFGSSFILGAHNMLETSTAPHKKKSTMRSTKTPIDQVISMSRIAMGLLYGYGVCNGEGFAKHFLEPNVASTPRTLSAILEVFADALSATGWGEFSFSALSNWSESSEDVWVVCHVTNAFEADDRLGNVWDSGSPTCMCMAGAIGGYCTQAFGVRCVCVEVECVGCGTSRFGRRCSFLCSVPATLSQRTKLYMAAINKEEVINDLVGGLRVRVFEDSASMRDDASMEMAAMIKNAI